MKAPIEQNAITVEDEKTYICSDCGINETRIGFFTVRNRRDQIPKSQLELSKKFREKLKLGN